MENQNCYHCGNTLGKKIKYIDDKRFCCNGCKTVYEIFSANDMFAYYNLETAPGAAPSDLNGKFEYLDNQDIVAKLLDFNENDISIITLFIPHIHCSSCIWVLENLNKLIPAIRCSQVDFSKKKVSITYTNNKTTLKDIIKMLSSIGYEPTISLDDYTREKTEKKDYSILYKLGIAGFAFGNVMFLSFPEYFEISEYWLEKYKHLFRGLMFIFSLPVIFYAAGDYFKSAFKGLKNRILNIDVPIALGILVLFLRSTIEILLDLGSGFFDSLTGLVFFLLVGKFFQQKTYSFLSFERDYKSYFPIAVTRLTRTSNSNQTIEENIQLYTIKKGDTLLIRHGELIPVDCILAKGTAAIDYSFVTGESETLSKKTGDKLFAGGKQLDGAIEVEVLKTVEQSYLTKLWSKDAFTKQQKNQYINLIDITSKYFTISILCIALVATSFWLVYDSAKALNVFTAVLIIACPCALALARPFALGNIMRIFGRNEFYIKNADVIEELTKIDTIIFDKTGTITTTKKNNITYQGDPLSNWEERILKNSLRNSSHPLSRKLYDLLADQDIMTADDYEEIVGKGIEANYNGHHIKIGSPQYTGANLEQKELDTAVHIQTNHSYKGFYRFKNEYRSGIQDLFHELQQNYQLSVLSGDNDGEKFYLKKILPAKVNLFFNHKPDQKLEHIKSLQKNSAKVMMIGDGLNDAGALAQSNVGIVVSDNTNTFSPACDVILQSSKIRLLPEFLNLSKNAIRIIKSSIILSFLYNGIGLYFACTGQLKPVIAAILMPLSSISVVVYVTLLTNWSARRIKKTKPSF